jgi:4-hydroxybutyrate CoA-transferase
MTPTGVSAVKVEEVIARIQPGHRVFVHGAAATPLALLRELVRQADRLRDIELIHLHTEGQALHADPSLAAHFRVTNLFVGGNVRPLVDYDRVDYLPCFLSEIPGLFKSGRRAIDVALVTLSPRDAQGYHTLGTSVDVARAAVDSAPIVLAEVNSNMPRVHGDGFVPASRLAAWTEVNEALPEAAPRPIGVIEQTIGRNVASLIEDGSCLQFGIGAIPDAVARELRGHRHLGIHTEMGSDGMLELLRSGAVDNSRKKVHAGKTVASFLNGTRALYDFVHDNPAVNLLGADYVNNPSVIKRNPRTVAINSGVEIDLTGQICADSVGHRIISGVGGQMDFMRGATLSQGGKAILALTSRTPKGRSRIVSALAAGAGVVTTRAHVHFVVTEHGIADLYGRTLGERAKALIGIAHPEDREALKLDWRKVHLH